MAFLQNPPDRLDIFTWHIHGSYLYYLSQGNYNLYIPTDQEKSIGYGGRGDVFPFGENVIEIPAHEVKMHSFDCILFQSEKNYLLDQYEIFSQQQREQIPMIYLEHDPPRKHPTDTRHIMEDPSILLVHVTQFNKLMWDNGGDQVTVVEHGITVPDVHYSGDLNKGAVVVNNLPKRGRRLGADIFLSVRDEIPLDLIGMDSAAYGGLGEIPLPELPALLCRYRFFFNPIRYTSMGLAVCEAMMLDMPVVGLATTEMVTVIKDGVSGFIDTNIFRLIEKMKQLLEDPSLAISLGKAGGNTARERFNIKRFTEDWSKVFHRAIASNPVIKQGYNYN
ncbi:MAG TPA: glycosyltransferase [Chitinophagaceae bacterium]|nr:glycosyltransferase [Chitinophagaceae bacterium]